MKKIILFILLISSISLFSQSRKKLLKEINTFKTQTYKNKTYTETKWQLTQAIGLFFKEREYLVRNTPTDGNSLVFYKTILLSCSSGRNKRYHNGASYYECRRRLVVTITFSANADQTKKIDVSTEITNPKTFNRILYERVLGTYSFNKTELYKYIFTTFNKEEVVLSKQLQNKIEKYNKKHKKDKKKITKGRDY